MNFLYTHLIVTGFIYSKNNTCFTIVCKYQVNELFKYTLNSTLKNHGVNNFFKTN